MTATPHGAVRFTHRNFGAPDLTRRGLTAASAPETVLLLDIEADLLVTDAGRTVWHEDAFPVAELAGALAHWLRLPDDGREDFAFDSMSYDVPGAVRITAANGSWRVDSVFAPADCAAPSSWTDLRPALVSFVEAIRAEVRTLGIAPDFIPALRTGVDDSTTDESRNRPYGRER